MSVSTATRLRGSCVSMASRIESLIWSAILSGWPSVTDSEVKRRRGTRYSLGTVVRSTSAAERPSRHHATCWGRRPVVLAGGMCLVLGRARQLGRDRGPDPRGNGVLAAVRQFGDLPTSGENGHRGLGAAEDLTAGGVIDDQQVAALARQLGPRVG